MRPTSTIYRLAKAGGEYNKLYAMLKRQSGEKAQGLFDFPTVVAVRGGEVIGFLATVKHEKAIICGPLVLRDGPNVFVGLRLLDAYERVLRAAGVKAYFTLVPESHKGELRLLEDGLSFKRMGVAKETREVGLYRELV